MKRTGRTPTPLEDRLGYVFRDEALLRTALTPPSSGLTPDNQRLEFLGDSILDLCVSLLAYREHPTWPEGSLSKLRGLLVCTDALHAWAGDLGVALETGPRSPRKGGANLRNALADAMEALLAAVFLDLQASGFTALDGVLAIVERRFLEEIRAAYLGIWESKDHKTTLQERGAALGLPPPQYELVERLGPDHAPSFTVRAGMGGFEAVGRAGTLKRAQMEAARLLLAALPPGAKPPS
ncbi:ribonuclease III family protein [Mesoterricola silvestris]|uniref:Ribonuclease 3 n=1 Tax=Mesoterricola silvestris TaxID=2927979 RepID=A0AA48GVS4_9BACT|nr:ribonuclease III domain-containing protein [Mesoterricola silvestris]BDU74972.1 ribonuclease 3 [Mesoterricola silvestris]